jgi:hypothetical protein
VTRGDDGTDAAASLLEAAHQSHRPIGTSGVVRLVMQELIELKATKEIGPGRTKAPTAG